MKFSPLRLLLLVGVFGGISWPASAQQNNPDPDQQLYNQIMQSGQEYFKEAKAEALFPETKYFLELLRQENYNTLEQQMQKYQKGRFLPDGNDPLSIFFNDVEFESTDEAYLDDWCKKYHKSPYAFLSRGCFRMQSAWEVRGNGFSSTVKPEQWKVVNKYMALAGEDFKYAERVAPSLGLVYIKLVQWASKGSSDLEQTEAYFTKGEKLLKGNIMLFMTMFYAYTPRWGGSREQMANFVNKSIGQYPRLGMLMGFMHEELASELNNYDNHNKLFFDYFQKPGIWEQIYKAYQPVIKAFPHSKRRRMQLITYAIYADRLDELYSWYAKEKL